MPYNNTLRDKVWILALALAAFGASIGAPFHLDDHALFQDPVITSPSGWWQSFELRQTRPLTWLTFWINYQSGGGFHAVNLMIHLASVLVAAVTLPRLMPSPAALLAAVIFSLHPIQTEAVVYVFARATLLMSLFCLLSLRAWTSQRHWLAVLWFGLALMAKEECVSFPVVLALLHLSISRNVRERKPIAAMLGLSLLFGLRVLWASASTAGSGAGAQSGVAPLDYLSVQGLALLRYLRLFLLPFGFSIESPIELHAAWWAWIPIVVITALLLKRFDRAKAGFWWLAALVLLAPSSSILPAWDLSADRRMYLPLIGLGACAAALLPIRTRWVTYGVASVLAILSARQTLVWSDPVKLWRQAIEAAPRKPRPYVQLARLSPPKDALALLASAESFAPREPMLASEKGRIQLENGDPEAALSEFGRALALAPDDPRAMNNRGVALWKLGQTDAAMADFQRALRMDPCFHDARLNLAKLGGAGASPAQCRYTPEQRRNLDSR